MENNEQQGLLLSAKHDCALQELHACLCVHTLEEFLGVHSTYNRNTAYNVLIILNWKQLRDCRFKYIM